MQTIFAVLAVFLLIRGPSLCHGQEARLVGMTAAEHTQTLKLREAIERRQLIDISKDGKLLLFRETGSDNLIRYRLQAATSTATRTKPARSVFVLYDRATMQDIRRLQSLGNLSSGVLTPSGREVLVSEDYKDGRFLPHNQLWSLNGKTTVDICPGNLRIQRADLWPLSDTQFIGHSYYNAATYNSSVVLKISVDTCSTEAMEASGDGREPTGSTLNIWALSGDNSTMAYLFRRLITPRSGTFVEDIWIRNTSNLRIRTRIEPLEGWTYSELALSRSGDRIAAGIFRGGLLWDPRSEHRVVVYDAASGEQMANYSIDGRMGLAFSPDGKYLLAGQRLAELDSKGREKRVRARVAMHRVDSGEAVGTGDFPWVKRPRLDPFAGNITKLAFTPDGMEVIASTYETRIWRIDSPE